MHRQLSAAAGFAFVIMTLSGCASMTADECRTANWYEVGIKDGSHGKPAERIVQHREACADVKIWPDEARYLQGRQIGLRNYCTPENAVREGLAGNSYEGVCAGPVSTVFERNFNAARAVYEAKRHLANLDSSVSYKESELRSDKTAEKRRGELRSEIREIDRQRERARDDVYGAERNLDRILSGR